MSIDQLSKKSRETLERLALLNNTTPEKMLKAMNLSLDRVVVTRHPLNLKLT